MRKIRWYDNHQPQTLQGAVILLYLKAILTIFYLLSAQGPLPRIGVGGSFSVLNQGILVSLFLTIVILVIPVVGGAGIANEKKWAYWLSVLYAVISLALILWSILLPGFGLGNFFNLGFLLNLAFAIVLVALLLHQHSRTYKGLWFR